MAGMLSSLFGRSTKPAMPKMDDDGKAGYMEVDEEDFVLQDDEPTGRSSKSVNSPEAMAEVYEEAQSDQDEEEEGAQSQAESVSEDESSKPRKPRRRKVLRKVASDDGSSDNGSPQASDSASSDANGAEWEEESEADAEAGAEVLDPNRCMYVWEILVFNVCWLIRTVSAARTS